MDWPACILCCCETIICCCTICSNIHLISKCFKSKENNFTNPVNPNNRTYIAEQPYSPQQFPSRYSPQPQFLPQQLGEQQNPTVSNSGLNLSPSENNNDSNQSTAPGMTSSNYLAPPPSYSEAMGMEIQSQPANSSNRSISKT